MCQPGLTCQVLGPGGMGRLIGDVDNWFCPVLTLSFQAFIIQLSSSCEIVVPKSNRFNVDSKAVKYSNVRNCL